MQTRPHAETVEELQTRLPAPHTRISIWWENYEDWFPATVLSEPMNDQGRVRLCYDDGDRRKHENLCNCVYKIISTQPSEPAEPQVQEYDQIYAKPFADTLTCSICRGLLEDPVTAKCGHLSCQVCIKSWLARQRTCPICREQIFSNRDLIQLPMVEQLVTMLKKAPSSTKLSSAMASPAASAASAAFQLPVQSSGKSKASSEEAKSICKSRRHPFRCHKCNGFKHWKGATCVGKCYHGVDATVVTDETSTPESDMPSSASASTAAASSSASASWAAVSSSASTTTTFSVTTTEVANASQLLMQILGTRTD